MHSVLIYFQEISHHYEINKYFTMELTSPLLEIQFTIYNPSKIINNRQNVISKLLLIYFRKHDSLFK